MQVNKSVYVNTVSTTIIHTVTAGKTFILKALHLSRVSAAGVMYILVRNAADDQQYLILHSVDTTLYFNSLSGLNLRMGAGWDICLVSNAAVYSAAFISGEEI